MPRDWKLRIEDILSSINRIKDYTAGLSSSNFLEDQLVVDAVLRNFSIIGEAVRYIPENVQAENPQVPWAQIKGMRNIIVHEYFGVSLEILWYSIQNEIPNLEKQLKEILTGQN